MFLNIYREILNIQMKTESEDISCDENKFYCNESTYSQFFKLNGRYSLIHEAYNFSIGVN